MTFARNDDLTAGEEGLGVKVSYGNQLRRAPFNGSSFIVLRDLVVLLFELPLGSVVGLKYQDDDGDVITMSTDGEVREAVQLAKASKKSLRVFVEVSAGSGFAGHPVEQSFVHVPEIPAPEILTQAIPAPTYPVLLVQPAPVAPVDPVPPVAADLAAAPSHERHGHGSETNGRGHHGRHGHHGHHGHGSEAHHGHDHHRGKKGKTGDDHHHGRHGRHNSTEQTSQLPLHETTTPVAPLDGASPVSATERTAELSRDEMRADIKQRKHAMRETLQAMKQSASTREEKEAVKEFKKKMKAEYKEAKKEKYGEMKEKHGEKKEKHGEKREKRGEKKEKHEKKEKKEKKGKHGEKLKVTHLADVTIPDNSELPANTLVTKTWRMKNTGKTAWPVGSQLIFVSRRSDDKTNGGNVSGEPVLPQQEVDVSVTFITPSDPGQYICYYRMTTPDGDKFGKKVWALFLIGAPAVNTAMVQ